MSSLAVVIPIRGQHAGKSRLAPVLDPLQRSSLVRAMARHVLSVALASELVGTVYLVTHDPGLDWLVTLPDLRVRVLRQPLSHPGMNAAIEAGRDAALADGASGLLVLPADLPLLTVVDLETVLHTTAAVTVAPDRRGDGTNGLLLAGADPMRRFEFHFGHQSRHLHVDEAARLGHVAAIVDAPGFRFDLDTPADWAMLTPEVRAHLLRPTTTDAMRENALILEHA